MVLIQIIILMVIVFGGLLFALRQILTKNISSATSHLDDLNAEFIRREEEIRQREAQIQKQHDETVLKAKDEADRVRMDTERQVQQERDRILEEARRTSEEIIEKAQKTREMMVNELRHEMETKILGRMRDLMKAVFPQGLMEHVHRRWLADLIAGGLVSLSSVRIPEDVSLVRLMSAFALTAEEKAALAKKLRETLGRELSFQEEVDPSLVAGLVIVIGSAVLDGSAANKMEQVLSTYE
jgi:F0F1-type ATP synthase membrane subunit b/b'